MTSGDGRTGRPPNLGDAPDPNSATLILEVVALVGFMIERPDMSTHAFFNEGEAPDAERGMVDGVRCASFYDGLIRVWVEDDKQYAASIHEGTEDEVQYRLQLVESKHGDAVAVDVFTYCDHCTSVHFQDFGVFIRPESAAYFMFNWVVAEQ